MQAQVAALRGGGQPAREAGPVHSTSGIVTRGVLFKKHYCGHCGSELDKSWDGCPYCAGAAANAVQPAMPTRAIMIDPAGGGPALQMLGWLVPVKGPQRGELHTLAPVSSIGTDPSSTVCLVDGYMSARHAEIKAEGGVWILRDLGSTNGTYVNQKRIDQHELVDNDFVKFGNSLVKFKSL